MGEKLDTVFFFERVPPRDYLVEVLFTNSPLWMDRPREWFLLDYEKGNETKGDWANGRIPVHSLSRTEILFLYPDYQGASKPFNTVSIEEQDKTAVYTVAIELAEVVRHHRSVYEDWLMQIFAILLPFGPTIAFAGSEIGIPDASYATTARVCNEAFSNNTQSYWIILNKANLPDRFQDFEIVEQREEFFLLRRKTLAYMPNSPNPSTF